MVQSVELLPDNLVSTQMSQASIILWLYSLVTIRLFSNASTSVALDYPDPKLSKKR